MMAVTSWSSRAISRDPPHVETPNPIVKVPYPPRPALQKYPWTPHLPFAPVTIGVFSGLLFFIAPLDIKFLPPQRRIRPSTKCFPARPSLPAVTRTPIPSSRPHFLPPQRNHICHSGKSNGSLTEGFLTVLVLAREFVGGDRGAMKARMREFVGRGV